MNYTAAKPEEKAFWAMNANMAINNILNIIQYVSNTSLDDPGFNNLLTRIAALVNPKSKDQRKTLSRLLKCLPVANIYLKHIQNPEKQLDSTETMATELDKEFPREKFLKYLEACVFALYEIRNYFSHYKHNIYQLEYKDSEGHTRTHLHFLYTLLTTNLRIVKKRFYQDNEKTEDELFDPFRRYKGKNNDNTTRKNPNFCCDFFNEDNAFTKQGLIFFLCQFLERKYASQMLQSPYAKLERKSSFSKKVSPAEIDPRLILRIFTVHSLRLPKPRLEMTRSQSREVLGMDILNELHRCPGELFELLTPADQNKLRISVEDERESCFVDIQTVFHIWP